MGLKKVGPAALAEMRKEMEATGFPLPFSSDTMPSGLEDAYDSHMATSMAMQMLDSVGAANDLDVRLLYTLAMAKVIGTVHGRMMGDPTRIATFNAEHGAEDLDTRVASYQKAAGEVLDNLLTTLRPVILNWSVAIVRGNGEDPLVSSGKVDNGAEFQPPPAGTPVN